ncbi:MAG: hypothetical protein CSA39_05330 [Flavobacteriales bacterium]|nr:MAG: hypothetical protein CSA39_05330 [Flavobacteriales bacterium]
MLWFLLAVALFYFFIIPDNFLLFCPLYKTTGIQCPGCGSQRAFHQLLHGNLMGALQQNLLLLLGIIALVYHYGIKAVNRWFGKNFKSVFSHRNALWWGIGLAILFMIVRNLSWYPLNP